MAGSLLGLYLVGAIAFLVAPALVALGLFAMGMAPSLQYRVVSLAGPGSALAQSLPASAANAGIAFGSVAGGVAIGGFAASSAVITGLMHRRDRHRGRLGHRLPEAAGGRGGRAGASGGGRADPQVRITQPGRTHDRRTP